MPDKPILELLDERKQKREANHCAECGGFPVTEHNTGEQVDAALREALPFVQRYRKAHKYDLRNEGDCSCSRCKEADAFLAKYGVKLED